MSEIVTLLRHARLGRTRLGFGYIKSEVDDLLLTVAAAARAGVSVREVIDAVNLSSSGLREGYSCADVDDLLRQVRILDPVAPTPGGGGLVLAGLAHDLSTRRHCVHPADLACSACSACFAGTCAATDRTP